MVWGCFQIVGLGLFWLLSSLIKGVYFIRTKSKIIVVLAFLLVLCAMVSVSATDLHNGTQDTQSVNEIQADESKIEMSNEDVASSTSD